MRWTPSTGALCKVVASSASHRQELSRTGAGTGRSLTIYRESSISSSGRATVSSALANNYDPTDLTVIYATSPVYAGSGETDIIYKAGALLYNLLGVTWCDNAVSNYGCDQHYVQFDSSDPAQLTACHETGHAVGLTHGDDAYPTLPNQDPDVGCMGTPRYDGEPRTLSSIYIANINAAY